MKKTFFQRIVFFIKRKIHCVCALIHALRNLCHIHSHRSKGKLLVAIARIEHFGDIIACEPVLRYARRTYPTATIVWVLQDRYAELVEQHPCIDGLIKVDCLTEWIILRKYGAFDIIIDLHLQGTFCPRCCIRLNKAEGNLTIDGSTYYYHEPLLSAFCKSAGIPVLNERPKMLIPKAHLHSITCKTLPERYVIFHCRSNDEMRNCKYTFFQNLAEKIEATFEILVFEVGIYPVLQNMHSRQTLGGSFIDMANIVKNATLFVGIESGVAHLCNAMEIPAVLLLGEYDPFHGTHCPYSGINESDLVRIIHADGIVANVDINKAFEAVKELLLLCKIKEKD